MTYSLNERSQRRVLRVFAVLPGLTLIAFIPFALCLPPDWSSRLAGLGLALEIGGVLGLLLRALAEELGFWLARTEADKWTLPMFYAGGPLVLIGFILQYVAVVFL